jgi:hypothetical protein
MRTLITIAVVVAVLACAARLGFHARATGAEQDAVMYCRMVHADVWPDYKHVAARQCKTDGTVNWDYVNGK